MRDWNTCPVGRVWDDKKKGCELLSTTCRDCLWYAGFPLFSSIDAHPCKHAYLNIAVIRV